MDYDSKVSGITIHHATKGDSQMLRQLALDASIDAWSVEDYSNEVDRHDSIVIKAVSCDLEIIGFLAARMVPGNASGPDSEIYNIAVHPCFKRRGIGTLLLRACLERLRSRSVNTVWLEVRESNEEAITFYFKHGFLMVSTRKNFYSDPVENAVIMRVFLPQDQIVKIA